MMDGGKKTEEANGSAEGHGENGGYRCDDLVPLSKFRQHSNQES